MMGMISLYRVRIMRTTWRIICFAVSPLFGMLVAATEDGVDDVTAPSHLERLEAQDLLIGGFDAMALRGLVVFHDHGVDVQLNDTRCGDREPPVEKLLKQPWKKIDSLRGKGLVEPLDGVRGGHVLRGGFDDGGVARVLGQGVEVRQMATGAVEKKIEHLLEQLINGRAFWVLAHGAEEAVKMRKKIDAAQGANEGVEPGPAGQAIVGDLDIVDEICPGGFARGHPALHQMGEPIMVVGWM